jgi:hypothetical protein
VAIVGRNGEGQDVRARGTVRRDLGQIPAGAGINTVVGIVPIGLAHQLGVAGAVGVADFGDADEELIGLARIEDVGVVGAAKVGGNGRVSLAGCIDTAQGGLAASPGRVVDLLRDV